MLDRVHGYVEPHLGVEQGAFWIIDDTGHRKYGTHSVGVAHQYCGQLGKDDNCQVAVSLSLASARGRVPTRLRRGRGHQPLSVKALALQLKDSAWHTVTWREGTNKTLSSRFACLRVRAAHRDRERTTMRAEEWLLIEWPRAEAEPIKYWLSSLPADTPIEQLVDTAKMRWRIEHDYHELKQEFGLSHYEGRGWCGFHHHATLCIAAYAFLMAQRLKEGSKKNGSARSKASSLSQNHPPRGSRQSAAPRARLDSNAAVSNRLRARAPVASLPVLPAQTRMTQYN